MFWLFQTVNVGILSVWKTEAVLCRNASMDLCQCETGEWQGFQDGMWTAVNSPYGNKYVDVKLADKKPARFTLSIQQGQDCSWNQFLFLFSNKLRASIAILSLNHLSFVPYIYAEFQKWRLACLGIGFVLLFLSPIVSKWAPFYYSSSMALGILLVVLIVIFQVYFLKHIYIFLL